MGKSAGRLPDAELEVMQAAWSCSPPVFRTDIEDILRGKGRPMAATTVLTLLARLTERRFLSVDKCGRSNCYTPLISRRGYLAAQSKRFFRKLCGGDMTAFATALCDSGLSKADREQLRRLLEHEEL